MRLGLRRRRPIIGDRKPCGGRPRPYEVEGDDVTREIGADKVDWDWDWDWGGATGDRCVEWEDPRLEADLGAASTDRRCGRSGSDSDDSDEESGSSCRIVPLDCDAFRGERTTPMGGTPHSIMCEGRVSILVGRGLASNTT
jgi:hypothetical protein